MKDEAAPNCHAANFSAPPTDMPVPDRLNFALVVGVFVVAVSLLWLGSHVKSGWAVLGVGVVYS